MHHFLTSCTSSPFDSQDAVLTFPRSAILHTWALFVHEGDITSANSIENPDKSLCEELTFTYIEGSHKTWECVGSRWWGAA